MSDQWQGYTWDNLEIPGIGILGRVIGVCSIPLNQTHLASDIRRTHITRITFRYFFFSFLDPYWEKIIIFFALSILDERSIKNTDLVSWNLCPMACKLHSVSTVCFSHMRLVKEIAILFRIKARCDQNNGDYFISL